MASTITLTGDWLVSLGNRLQTSGTGNLGTYATNGIAVTAGQVGLGVIHSMVIDPAGGYTFEYVAATGKIKAYAAGGAFTPEGSVADHTHDLTYIGGIAATEPVVIAGGDTLGKNAATNRTIAGADSATKGGVASATLVFTGDAGSVSVAEVAALENLAAITFNWRAIGI